MDVDGQGAGASERREWLGDGVAAIAQAVASVRLLALLLRDLHRSRNHPVERARMELLIERTTRILDDMTHYGSYAKGAVVTRTA